MTNVDGVGVRDMPDRTVEDLDNSYGSIGGAMSKWPTRTLAWSCRDMRANQLDHGVVSALIEQDIEQLQKLSNIAQAKGIDVSHLSAKIDALEQTDTGELLRLIQESYKNEYSLSEKCPYQEYGKDMACWSCPVAGNALESATNKKLYPPEKSNP